MNSGPSYKTTRDILRNMGDEDIHFFFDLGYNPNKIEIVEKNNIKKSILMWKIHTYNVSMVLNTTSRKEYKEQVEKLLMFGATTLPSEDIMEYRSHAVILVKRKTSCLKNLVIDCIFRNDLYTDKLSPLLYKYKGLDSLFENNRKRQLDLSNISAVVLQ